MDNEEDSKAYPQVEITPELSENPVSQTELFLHHQKKTTIPWYTGMSLLLGFSVFVIVLGSFSFGFVIAVLNSPENAIRGCNITDPDLFFQPCVEMDDFRWSTIIVAFPIGALFGSLLGAPISDFIGRRMTLAIGHILVVLASFIMCFFSYYLSFLASRFLIGLGIGALSVLVPLFLAEISPVHLKGAIGTVNTLFNTGGILTTQILGIFLSFRPGWRILLATQAIPGILACILLFLVPNSPVWLIRRNRDEEAEKVLQRLRGKKEVIEEYQELIKSKPVVTEEAKPWFSWWRRELIRPLIAGVGLHAAQQFSGINVVFFYSTGIFSSAGIESASLVTAATGIVTVLANLVSMYFVDRFGRRALLFIGTGTQLASFTVLALCFIFNDYAQRVFGILSVLSVLVYIAGFSLALGPITWLILGELFPSDVKSGLSGLCASVNWICTAFIVLTFPFLRSFLGRYTFLPYCGCLVAILFFIYFGVPETKGK